MYFKICFCVKLGVRPCQCCSVPVSLFRVSFGGSPTQPNWILCHCSKLRTVGRNLFVVEAQSYLKPTQLPLITFRASCAFVFFLLIPLVCRQFLCTSAGCPHPRRVTVEETWKVKAPRPDRLLLDCIGPTTLKTKESSFSAVGLELETTRLPIPGLQLARHPATCRLRLVTINGDEVDPLLRSCCLHHG